MNPEFEVNETRNGASIDVTSHQQRNRHRKVLTSTQPSYMSNPISADHSYHHLAISFLALNTPVSQLSSGLTSPSEYNNSSGDEIANVNFYAVRPKATRIRWNNANYAVQGHSRLFKVTDFGTNRKLIYDFLLVINTCTNLPHLAPFPRYSRR